MKRRLKETVQASQCEAAATLRIDSQLQPNSADGEWMQTELSNHISYKTLNGCRKGEERKHWKCIRGLEEPRRRHTGEQKEPFLPQYVLAYGYTCSNATLIMQSCLPCQLTGLLVQKLDFAHTDIGSKTPKRKRSQAHIIINVVWMPSNNNERKSNAKRRKGTERKHWRKRFK